MPIYVKRINPKDEVINNILKEGYGLHSITPVNKGYVTDLIYHFIKEVADEPNYNIGTNFFANEMPNPFEPPRIE